MENPTPSASPPTRRVVDVLGALVARPGERLGLSELARACGISKPTCLAILTELTAHGYLRMDADSKTYGLGPSLVVAGQAAQRAFALDPAVAARMQALSDACATMVVAAVRDADEFVVVEVTTPAGMRPLATPGQTFPVMLPTALMFTAWQDDGPRLAGVGPAEWERMARECQTVGYLVENLSPTLERVYRIMGASGHALAPEVLELIGDLLAGMSEQRLLYRSELADDPAAVHRVGAISAPCFGPDGEQSLMLAMRAHADLTSADIAARGSAVRDAADDVTAVLGGRTRHG